MFETFNIKHAGGESRPIFFGLIYYITKFRAGLPYDQYFFGFAIFNRSIGISYKRYLLIPVKNESKK